jgi:RHS repeat-associated protein
MQALKQKRCQARTRPRKNACVYGAFVSEPTHYNYFRSYDAKTGRYTQSDPVGMDGGLNRFGYVGGNALGLTDPMGLQAIPIPPLPIPGVPNQTADAQRALADRLSRALRNDSDTTYQTYTRYNPSTGQCYPGRTSGDGTPEANVRNRGYGQPLLNAEGFNPPVLDRSSSSYNAIRGREQQLIELNGGARSSGGDSRNMINGIGRMNLAGPTIYTPAANSAFGTPVPAGNCTCQ